MSPLTEHGQRKSCVYPPLKKKRLLILVDWFDPAVRAGGPVRSCVNLVEQLASDTDIAVLTGDRDLGVSRAFGGVRVNQWNNWKGKARVFYAKKRCQSCLFKRLISRFQPDAVYLNSMFSSRFTLLPLLTKSSWSTGKRVVLAPRGMLKPSALRNKPMRKSAALAALRWSGSLSDIVFHATSDAEVDEVKDSFGDRMDIRQIANVPVWPKQNLEPIAKEVGSCRLCFVGRIHPIKNLLHLLKQLRKVKGACHLDVVGPAEDPVYTAECQAAADKLPGNVSVDFLGARSPEQVCSRISCSHATVSPTLGENFGHSIFESFALGVPAIISDQTIWRNLEPYKAGWDISLSSRDGFARAIDQVCQFDADQLKAWRLGALEVAREFHLQNNLRADYREMFFPPDSGMT